MPRELRHGIIMTEECNLHGMINYTLVGIQRKAHSNVLETFDICSELQSDSEKHSGFVVDEFFELVHSIKSLCSVCSRHLVELGAQ